MRKKILVLGGYGTFGRRIATRLAADAAIECIVAGRSAHRARAFAGALNTPWRQVEITQSESVRAALAGVFAVVNTYSPFQARHYDLPELCARHGVHYVDLANSRAYVKGFVKLNNAALRAGCMLVCGASALPALSSVLADAIGGDFSSIESVHGYACIGGRHPRGLAAMRVLLDAAGAPLKLKDRGHWRNAYGWSEAATVALPAPLGARRMYLYDAPDLDIFPERYTAASVGFHVVAHTPAFGRFLGGIGWARRHGFIKDPLRLAGLLARLARLLGAPTHAGLLGVHMRGLKAQAPHTRAAYLVARDNSAPAIMCSPAVALIKKWVHQGAVVAGAFACVGLLDLNDIRAELADEDIVLILS